MEPLRFVNNHGYVLIKVDGELVKEHRLVWEKGHGPIPDGHQIHHRNHVRHDNRLENLECLNTEEHKRAHCGHFRRDGAWWKRCTQCGTAAPESDFPTKKIVGGVRMTRGNFRACESARQRAKKVAASNKSRPEI